MNGITGWRMQANEPQCLSALLTQPEAKLELLLQQLTAGRCPPSAGGVPLSCAGTARFYSAACGDQAGRPWAPGGVHGVRPSP